MAEKTFRKLFSGKILLDNKKTLNAESVRGACHAADLRMSSMTY